MQHARIKIPPRHQRPNLARGGKLQFPNLQHIHLSTLAEIDTLAHEETDLTN